MSKLKQVFLSIEEVRCLRLLSSLRQSGSGTITWRISESEARTDTYVMDFVVRMKELCPGVKVELQGPPYRNHTELLAYPRTPRNVGKQQTKDEWIKCMNEFHHLLSLAEKKF